MNGLLIRRKSFPTYSSVNNDSSPESNYLAMENERVQQLSYPLPQIAIKKTKDGQIVEGVSSHNIQYSLLLLY